MKLLDIISAAQSSVMGMIDLQASVDFTASPTDAGDPTKAQTIPFSYHPDDTTGLNPQVKDWFAANPNFTVGSYVAPAVTAADPLTLTLTRRQINAALIKSGTSLTPDAFVRDAITAITDTTAQALALNDWENASYYKRDHALFNNNDLLTKAGLTAKQVDQLWTLAVTLQA